MSEKVEYYGLLDSPFDERDYTIKIKNTKFPNTFQLKMPPAKNQWMESTCVAFAGSSIIEYFFKKENDNYETIFSTEYIYGLGHQEQEGDGMYLRSMLNILLHNGDCIYPYCKGNNDWRAAAVHVNQLTQKAHDNAKQYCITAYFRLNSIEEIKYALMNYGPVVISMTWNKKYKLQNGMYVPTSEEEDGRHAVVIYGWNEKGWLVQNSWGVFWGEKGRFQLPFDFKFHEAWGVSDNNENPELKKPSKITTYIRRIANSIANLFSSLFRRKS